MRGSTLQLACVDPLGRDRRTTARRFQRDTTWPSGATQGNPGEPGLTCAGGIGRAAPSRAILGLVCFLAAAAAACSNGSPSLSAEGNEATLTGVVTSDKEGPMEGVLVSARLGTVTTTVVTDKSGRYTFPSGRLTPGRSRMRACSSRWTNASVATSRNASTCCWLSSPSDSSWVGRCR